MTIDRLAFAALAAHMALMTASDHTDIRFTGGTVFGPEGPERISLGFSAGRFALDCGATQKDCREIDATGLWLLPGIVDLHGDGFERHLAPRRGVVRDMGRALDWVEAELAVCGITTGWLAQFWSWEGGMRAPEFALRLAQSMADSRTRRRIDMRLQLRLETHMIEDGPAIEALVDAGQTDYVVFNDHLPHAFLEAGKKPPRLAGSAAKAGRSPAAHLGEMERLHALRDRVPTFVSGLSARLRKAGVSLGSHDDPDAETRVQFGDYGLWISEFPVRRSALESAMNRGEPVVMGAPNVVRGGSHNRGGISAQDMIRDGLVSALASDYHYPSLAGAAWKLLDEGDLSFEKAWSLVSTGPARVMNLADRGRIADGAQADLVAIDPETRRILGTFSKGRAVVVTGPLADVALSL